jgi:hypothetical protein
MRESPKISKGKRQRNRYQVITEGSWQDFIGSRVTTNNTCRVAAKFIGLKYDFDFF